MGGRFHIFLGLVLPAATYQTLTGVALAAPVNPGPVPTIPAGATGLKSSALERGKKSILLILREFNSADNSLQQHLLGCFGESCLHGLCNRHTGYNNVSTLQIITHMYTIYGVITPTYLKENYVLMMEPFDAYQPIEYLFDQIEDAFELASSGVGAAGYNAGKIVSQAYLLLLKIGLYKNA